MRGGRSTEQGSWNHVVMGGISNVCVMPRTLVSVGRDGLDDGVGS